MSSKVSGKTEKEGGGETQSPENSHVQHCAPRQACARRENGVSQNRPAPLLSFNGTEIYRCTFLDIFALKIYIRKGVEPSGKSHFIRGGGAGGPILHRKRYHDITRSNVFWMTVCLPFLGQVFTMLLHVRNCMRK